MAEATCRRGRVLRDDAFRPLVSKVAEAARTRVESARDGDEGICMLEGRRFQTAARSR
jgi:hypothetical protein